MSSTVRRDLSAAVLDQLDTGKACSEVFVAVLASMAAAGFELLYSSGVGVEDKLFGTEVLQYGRLQSNQFETPLVLCVCVRVRCSATSKPRLTCIAELELHRDEAPERPQVESDSLMAKLPLGIVKGEALVGVSEEEHCRSRHVAICEALRSNIASLSSGLAAEFVENALAP